MGFSCGHVKDLGVDRRNPESLEPTLLGDFLLKLNHPLLVQSRISRIAFKLPVEELVRVVGSEIRIQNTQTLAIVGNLRPIPLHVLEILAEVSIGAFVDLLIDWCRHNRLDIDVLLVGLGRTSKDVVGSLLDSLHELCDFVRVLGDELLVPDVKDGAEAAASELGQFVDAEHLDIGLGTRLSREPFFELDHLDILEADTSVDFALNDGL